MGLDFLDILYSILPCDQSLVHLYRVSKPPYVKKPFPHSVLYNYLSKKSLHILYSSLLYKVGQYFLDKQ